MNKIPIEASTILLLRGDTGVDVSGSDVTKWNDQSSNGNYFLPIATPANSPTYADNELTFNGVDQFLVHWDTVNKTFGNFGTGNFTISIRFKHNPLNTYDQLFSKGSQVSTNYVFGFWADGASVNFGTNFVYMLDPTTLVNTNYYIATIVRDGDIGRLYLDGTLVLTSATYFNGQTLTNTVNSSIGSRANGSDHFFTGIISDVKIDNNAQTQLQIQNYINWIANGRTEASLNRGYKKYSKYKRW